VVDHNINHYLYRKRGVYYFSRRIPLDLQDQYSQTRIAASLKTKSLSLGPHRHYLGLLFKALFAANPRL
jgi:hypothetical protein